MPIDRVRPLKLETPTTGGTEDNLRPTALDPAEDFVDCKGVAFNNSENTRLAENSGALEVYTSNVLRAFFASSGGFQIENHASIGADASINANISLYINEVATTAIDNTAITALAQHSNIDASANGSVGGEFGSYLSGASGKLSSMRGIVASVTQDSSAGANAVGNISAGYFATLHSGTSQTEDVYGVYVSNVLSDTFGTPTVDNLFGVFIGAANTGSTVTGYTGLYIESASGVGTTSWAIRSAGGDSYHVGNFRFGGTSTPTEVVSVTGNVAANGLKLNGATSGTLTINPTAITTSHTLTMPSAQGGSNTYLKNDGSGTLTWSSVSTTISIGDTVTSGTTGSLLYVGAGPILSQLAIGTAGKILRSNGTLPVYSTATYPDTTTINQILYSSSTNVIAGLATANTSALVTNSSGVPNLTSGSTANRLLRTDGTTVSFAQAALTTDVTGTLPIANGGTGVTTGAWNRVGNSGLVDNTSNILGTTDAIDVQFTANNVNKFDLVSTAYRALDFYPGGYTFTAAQDNYWIGSSSAITSAGTTSTYFSYFHFDNIFTVTSNFLGLYSQSIGPTIRSDASARSITSSIGVFNQPTYQCGSNNLTVSIARDFAASSQIVAPVTSGTATLTEFTSFHASPGLYSGVATTLHCFRARPTVSGGTITTGYGLRVESFTATTAYGVAVEGTLGSVFGGRVQVGTTTLSTARTLGVTALGAADNILFLKSAASQTGEFIKAETSAGNEKFSVEPDGEIRTYGTSGYVGFKTSGTVTSYSLTYPTATGSSGQTLITDGSGNLSWSSPSGATVKHTLVAAVNGVGGNATSDADFGAAGANAGVKMAYAGTVVALSIHMSSTRTAGTCIAKWTKNGVVQSNTVTINATNPDHHYATFTGVSFALGDRLGLQTVTSSFTPTGSDATLALWVVY